MASWEYSPPWTSEKYAPVLRSIGGQGAPERLDVAFDQRRHQQQLGDAAHLLRDVHRRRQRREHTLFAVAAQPLPPGWDGDREAPVRGEVVAPHDGGHAGAIGALPPAAGVDDDSSRTEGGVPIPDRRPLRPGDLAHVGVDAANGGEADADGQRELRAGAESHVLRDVLLDRERRRRGISR